MREYLPVRQEKTGFRRLFTAPDLELYVWYDRQGGEIVGFQLVYPVGDEKKAFTWTNREGYSHLTVDGWDNTAYLGTPFLVADGVFRHDAIVERLRTELQDVEEEIRTLVLEKIAEYSE